VFLIVLFTGLVLLLNFYGPKIPAPYMPSLLYYLWEIPIVTAFVLCGVKVGFFTALTSIVGLLQLQRKIPCQTFYCLAATIGMLLGVGITKFYASKHSLKGGLVQAFMFTFSGAILRTTIVMLVFLAFLGSPQPLGFSFSEPATAITIMYRAVYDFSLAFYTTPLGYIIAEAIKRHVKV
jgi:hypothetical protein